jgi:sugar lactone lactonase YvrE
MIKITVYAACAAAMAMAFPVAAEEIQMPDTCTNPDGMCVDSQGRLVIACPNNDRKQPGAVFRIEKPGEKPVKWFDVPVCPESGYSAPMGICFGPAGELYVCDNQKDSKGRLLCVTFKDDKIDSCEAVAVGLDNANGVKYLNGKLYLTQAFLYGVKRGDGAASSGLYMFDAKSRNVRVGNTPADEQCVFSDVTRNPEIRGGLNGVAVDSLGRIYTGNYGDGHVWRLTPGADGRIVKSEIAVPANGGIVTPDGMCADGRGNIYVADMRGDAAVVITKRGKVKTVRKGGYKRPSEPCLWKGELYVANYGGTTLEKSGAAFFGKKKKSDKR